MSGQGAIGFGIAIVQFLSAWSSSSSDGTSDEDDKIPGSLPPNQGDKIIASTFRFLLVSLIFIFIAGIAMYTLIKLPAYEHAMQRHKQLEASQDDEQEGAHINGNGAVHIQSQHHKSSIWQVNRKIRDLGWSIAYIYAVTIGLFPGITSLIRSVNDSRDPTFSNVSSSTCTHGLCHNIRMKHTDEIWLHHHSLCYGYISVSWSSILRTG